MPVKMLQNSRSTARLQLFLEHTAELCQRSTCCRLQTCNLSCAPSLPPASRFTACKRMDRKCQPLRALISLPDMNQIINRRRNASEGHMVVRKDVIPMMMQELREVQANICQRYCNWEVDNERTLCPTTARKRLLGFAHTDARLRLA